MIQSILFTHTDLDGIGCRIVYELSMLDKEKGKDYLIIHCDNGTIDNDVCNTLETYKDYIDENTIICFSDIVSHNDVLEEIKFRFKNIHIWDHHISNLKCLDVIENGIVVPENELGIKQSGTSLIYQHFIQDTNCTLNKNNESLLSEFVDCVRSYDTYEWKETNNLKAKQLNILFFMLGSEAFSRRYVEKLQNKDETKLISDNDMEFIQAKLNYEQSVIDKITPDKVYQMNLRGYRVAFLLGSRGANISEISYQFLHKYPEFDAFISFTLNDANSFSFRSIRDDVNVADIFAIPLSGGGHPKASGAPLTYQYVEEIFKILYKALNE